MDKIKESLQITGKIMVGMLMTLWGFGIVVAPFALDMNGAPPNVWIWCFIGTTPVFIFVSVLIQKKH